MKIRLYLFCAMTGGLLAPHFAHAGPADYVYTPIVVQGEREIDFKMGTSKLENTPRESAASLGFGYGASENWFTELYVKYKRENDEATFYDAVEWENKLQLTETGAYPVDMGLLVEVERPTNHAEGWEVKWGPLFQSQFGKTVLNANLLFQRNYQAEAPSGAIMQYQWQAKYLWQRSLDIGLQGFGEVGQWDHWEPTSERPNQAGPAIFGKILLGGRKVIQYNAAWLLGTSTAAPDNTFRMQVEYEF